MGNSIFSFGFARVSKVRHIFSSEIGMFRVIVITVVMLLRTIGLSFIQLSFVKLVQLPKFDKTSHVWQCMELVIV